MADLTPAADGLTYAGRSVAGAEPYLPGPGLQQAVNLTLFLRRRPLLLKGEPGSGKTRLARAVAAELGLPYEFWPIKSTSRARDGAYTYDAVRRLQDAQLAASDPAVRARVADAFNYVDFGPLGRAFRSAQPTVLLIDEIDKADIDFPNDLLLELDEHRFAIDELPASDPRREVVALQPPIVFITSNDEKDLPDAFLRRCLFHYIDFPSHAELVAIVGAHFAAQAPAADLSEAAVARFEELRAQMRSQAGRAGKTVSTSELLDWFAVLQRYPHDEVLAELGRGGLPDPQVLLKRWEDHLHFLQATGATMPTR